MGNPSAGAVDADIRSAIAAWVDRENLYAVSRALSTSRAGLASYLAGCSRAGTTCLIQTLYTGLYARRHARAVAEPAPEPAPKTMRVRRAPKVSRAR